MNIISKDNKVIKLARSLAEKKYRNEYNLFLIEGKRAVSELLKKSELIHSIFIAEEDSADFLDIINKQDLKTYLINQKLMKHISNSQNPQGIAAISKIPVWNYQEILEKSKFLLYLDKISDPGNLGTIIRTAWTFGIDGVLLGPNCVDIYNPKVVRATMGGLFNIAVFQSVELETLLELKQKDFTFLTADLDSANHYRKYNYANKTLLMMGSEAHGLSEEIKQTADYSIIIPINEDADSLNLTVACGVIIAEANYQRCPDLRL